MKEGGVFCQNNLKKAFPNSSDLAEKFNRAVVWDFYGRNRL